MIIVMMKPVKRSLTMDLFDDFLIRILTSGLLISLISGPIGCLLIWRKLAFFGDAVAHSSLLGIAIGVALGIDIRVGVLSFSLLLALSMGISRRHSPLSPDTRLALLSHGALACGLIAISFFPHLRGDLNSFLFGDLLALSQTDLLHIALLGCCALIILGFYWNRFLTLILSEDIAFVEGQNTLLTRLLFFMLVGIFVAIAAKAIGVLLMTALLVIPAAAARALARSPLQMAFMASFISALSFLMGFGISYHFDLPVAATIVVCALLFFMAISLIRRN
jgi:zinc transport system permease protein